MCQHADSGLTLKSCKGNYVFLLRKVKCRWEVRLVVGAVGD